MKLTIFKTSFFIILLIFTNTLNAQDHLLEGYILTHEGETVHGYIDAFNLNVGTNSSVIKFRQQKNDSGKEYDPTSIQAYSVGGQVYEGGFVDVELSPRDQNNLSIVPEFELKKQLVFLQTIVRGEKSLYVYKNNADNQFYIRNDSVYELLLYKKYIGNKSVQGESRLVISENKNYLQQLDTYLTGCPEKKQEIASSKYNQKDLTRLFLLYYNCTKEEFRSFVPKRKNSLRLGVMASYSFTSMDFNYTLSNVNIDHVAQRPMALGFNINGRVSPRVLIMGEFFLVRGYNHSLPTEYFNGPNYTVELKHLYYASSKKTSIIARYAIPLNKFQVFGNVGASYERVKGVYEKVQTTTSVLTSRQNSYPYGGKQNFYRLSAGAGVMYSRLSLEARVEPALIDSYLGSTVSFIFGCAIGKVQQ